MNENNFNVCNKCGGANPLVARYCFQCGFELKSPEAPVVCVKCSTVNPSNASFCKRCGSKLHKVEYVRACPKCSASNKGDSAFCANCGYDFNTHSYVHVKENAMTQLPQTHTEVAVTRTSATEPLSRREQKRLKIEQEEREYIEALEEKKRLKAEKRLSRNGGGKTVEESQFSEATAFAPKKKRFKNFVTFVLMLAGLYLLLLPQQVNFLNIKFSLATMANGTIAFSGWDLAIASISNFVSTAPHLSSVVLANGPYKSFEMIFTGLAISAVSLFLLCIILAKFVGIFTGRANKGFAVTPLVLMLLSGGLIAYKFFSNSGEVALTPAAFMLPALFLLLTLLNSERKIKN